MDRETGFHGPMATTGTTPRDLSDPALYVNREFSWLDFNARVLALAADPSQPLLERCKFLAIFSSNLDEFFMVRVASVIEALEAGRPSSTPDRLSREQVLAGIRERVLELVDLQASVWRDDVRPALAAEGIVVANIDDLPGGAYACLEVGDDGCGMSSDTIKSIFDPFFFVSI